MTDEEIRQAAREICSLQAQKDANSDASDYYLNGNYDHTIWMRLVEQGIRKGIEQHEAYKQKVSDAVEGYFQQPNYLGKFNDTLGCFIIPKPKPDPLVEVVHEVDNGPAWDSPEDYCNKIHKALEALGFEIREKGQ
jgi:hypothetical protein